MNRFTPAFIALILCFRSLALASPLPEPASQGLPHVTSKMLSAGYWISKHPNPDMLIMDSASIKQWNDHIQDELNLTKDIFALVDRLQLEPLMDGMIKSLNDFRSQTYYNSKGSVQDEGWAAAMKAKLHLTAVVLGKAPEYGLVVDFADQRFLPTLEGLYAKKGDFGFDELQNSGLDMGTPVAIVHKSKDGQWAYVVSALSDGWVQIEHIAFGAEDAVKSYARPKDFVVITCPKADIYLDQAMTRFHTFIRMGMRLPLLKQNDQQWIVQIPLKDQAGKLQLVQGFIPKDQAHQGFLPYTARTIYQQAFKMLDKPYGWGDALGNQDCSRFLQMVFATVGLQLPRDSKNQIQAAEALASFDEKSTKIEKLKALETANGASTLLGMKGHILLYLGTDQGIPFAIHETSGYSAKPSALDPEGKQVRHVLNRVVVSDLSLGEGSVKGSLLKRLSRIIEIK